MPLELIHKLDNKFQVTYDEKPLLEYVYEYDGDLSEGKRPYFHPMYTLQGDLVTTFRPYDHRWHRGMSMTQAALSGKNFWGGPTYVRDQGYQRLDNVGRQQHEA